MLTFVRYRTELKHGKKLNVVLGNIWGRVYEMVTWTALPLMSQFNGSQFLEQSEMLNVSSQTKNNHLN